jgi:DNA-binding response OmpR family regulator
MLPLTAVADEAMPGEAMNSGIELGTPRLDGLRVLLVDADADARALATTVLETAGADVTAVAFSNDALDLLVELKPHVLVADATDDNGLLFLRRIRDLSGSSWNIPAAALLTSGTAEERTRALLAGFQTCAPKPVDPGELVAVVASLGHRTARAVTSTPAG